MIAPALAELARAAEPAPAAAGAVSSGGTHLLPAGLDAARVDPSEALRESSAPEAAPDWGARPFPLRLHPVAEDYGARFRALVAETMGGPDAPTTFGPTVAEADVYWRFELAAPGFVQLPADAPRRWRDQAIAGSTLALNKLVDEVVARAPQLEVYRTLADTLVNPNVGLTATPAGEVRVTRLEGGRTGRRIDRDEDREGARPDPPPRVAAGLDWDLRSDDDPKDAPLLGYGAWLSVANLGVSSVRMEWSVTTSAWSAQVRQRVYPRVYAYAGAESAERSLEPKQYATGLLWQVPPGSAWTVRLERRATLLPEPELLWLVSVRGELRTSTPTRGPAPLGDGGLCLPPLPERGPNELRPLNPPADWTPLPSCARLDGP